jgi:hypothetical protein
MQTQNNILNGLVCNAKMQQRGTIRSNGVFFSRCFFKKAVLQSDVACMLEAR